MLYNNIISYARIVYFSIKVHELVDTLNCSVKKRTCSISLCCMAILYACIPLGSSILSCSPVAPYDGTGLGTVAIKIYKPCMHAIIIITVIVGVIIKHLHCCVYRSLLAALDWPI